MMKFLLGVIFMIPLVFLKINFYWIFQFFFFMIFFSYMFMFSFDSSIMYVSWGLGIDLLSFILVSLSFWICSLMILASESVYKSNNYLSLFSFFMIVLMVSLYLAFSSLNLFVFYLFFEISLIPILVLIVGWGYQPERIEAGVYLLFYTLIVSLPMMIVLFYYYENYNSLDFYFLTESMSSLFFYLCMNLVFFVKIPMFMIHLWLPKAHVEASVAGSMILAGIMLKLGGYGLLRVMKIFIFIGLKINLYFMVISLLGGFFVSLICIRQSDVKALIAYSSVAHMGLVLAGILSMNVMGFWGAFSLMIAHGLCSSGLFVLANLMYERSGSRSLYLNKGLINILPSMSLWWFLLCSSNMAAPPSLNLLGEILLINSLVGYSWLMMVFLSLISFFSAVYSLYLYSFTQHGIYSYSVYSFFEGSFREYLLLFLHWVPLNLLILSSDYLVLWI
uniref:NADH-ubiquinone oxidoreductase chain 4 n=1 Tax=Coleoptera sp. 2 AH-2016 TaxID=1903824 RepID=A0A343C2G0_9COLE|nr:NADH dehydrogenase subunit 4 [Coleoptera sp. 2 AH-2016]